MRIASMGSCETMSTLQSTTSVEDDLVVVLGVVVVVAVVVVEAEINLNKVCWNKWSNNTKLNWWCKTVEQ